METGNEILSSLLDPSGPCGCSENCTCGCQDWAAELLAWQMEADDADAEDVDDDEISEEKMEGGVKREGLANVSVRLCPRVNAFQLHLQEELARQTETECRDPCNAS